VQGMVAGLPNEALVVNVLRLYRLFLFYPYKNPNTKMLGFFIG
jgi:hypothetical protein